MTASFASARVDVTRWAGGPPPGADELDQLVYLSNLVGQETGLVQPGGGNTSIKLGDALLVKGSGTDLRTIGRAGFTRLSLPALAPLRTAAAMSDADMMRFMASCTLQPDGGGPAPSVETPLHALLPHRVIAHTHDVATMSLTNVSDATAERLVEELFEGEVLYVPYVRPGFPLAKTVSGMVDRIPRAAFGLALAHHGLAVWGQDPRECYARLVRVVNRIADYLETSRRGRAVVAATPPPPIPAPEARQRCAEVVLPVVRGMLGSTGGGGGGGHVILHLDGSDDILSVLAQESLPALVRRGMATPEHILRAGRLPLWLELDPSAPPDQLAEAVRSQIARQRVEYEEYHRRHADAGERALDDWAKVVLAPGVGMITAFRDKGGAVTANRCYRAVLETITNAEAVGGFQFIPEAEVFAFEHWPLERRKIEEQDARERGSLLVPRHVAVVIGGGSGIGRAAAQRFAQEGAHVVVADRDAAAADAVATEIGAAHPGRAMAAPVDVRDDASLAQLMRNTVLEFGGLDSLFYTAGQAPRFAELTDIRREDLQQQLDVHYLGAVLAIGAAAAVMRRQRSGGSIVASVSKAALAPGRDAVAYGGSKAALLQALRVAAVELGSDGIRVNAINADQIDTPLFRQFAAQRAASRGISLDEQLAAYRQRNVMGVSLIPADVVADLAVLLASERFRFTTGDILTVDGGLPEAFPR
jgi:rhamnose utilization protein RhaD (predicted bifunctional aldolase and dehydrogenase)/NAD(P)-dependent dehydrogenase (short-subunit alcohol dehydrogenase family)